MATCPYYEYRDGGHWFGTSGDKGYCKECGQEWDIDSSQVKCTCNTDYGEAYKNCPVYKNAY